VNRLLKQRRLILPIRPDFYYLSIQEDEYIEWASFWAFLLSCVAGIIAARSYRDSTARFPWYFSGVAMFCFLIAMEEISWGQRVLGYRAPVYFLEHNFQQELNFHNVVATDYRKLALSLTIIGYGIALPLLGLVRSIRRILDRVGVIVPSSGLLPAFAATFLVYHFYPFSHSGEWVELMLGTSFLFSILPEIKKDGQASTGRSFGGVGSILIACGVVLALGLLSGAASRMQRDTHPATLQAARAEIEAIKRDFESGRVDSTCSLHKRLYTFVVKYEQNNLLQGEFAGLTNQGLPKERAEFLLDPWNAPYWIRDRCVLDSGQRVVFVYSFGPNRRRDSAELELRGDDVGAYISLP
jgi:hypothetical protein